MADLHVGHLCVHATTEWPPLGALSFLCSTRSVNSPEGGLWATRCGHLDGSWFVLPKCRARVGALLEVSREPCLDECGLNSNLGPQEREGVSWSQPFSPQK